MQRALFLFASLFSIANCIAQQYPFVQYTPKDGLVNSRVRKAYQDSRGRMYFLTYTGLSVYDGARFKNYTTENGLASDLVNDIIEVGADSLLVATNSGHINILSKGKLSLFKPGNELSPVGNQFYRHNKNEIYLSSDHGLYLLKNNRFIELNTGPLETEQDPSPYLGNITGYGNFLVLTTNDLRYFRGIFLFDIKNNRICDAIPGKQVFFVQKDQENRLWVGFDGRIHVLDTLGLLRGKLSVLPPPGNYQPGSQIASSNITFYKKDALVIYDNKKIVRMDLNGLVSELPLPEQISASGIRHILVDRENTIWLCNDGAGIYKITNSPLRIFENPAQKKIEGYVIEAFCSGEIIWYTTSKNQLFRKTSRTLDEFTSNSPKATYIFYETGEKLMANDDKNIYEAVIPKKGNRINFQKVITLPDSTGFGKKHLFDTKGNLLTTMVTGLGVWKKNKLLFHLPVQPSDIIEDLGFDKKNLLWVVTRYRQIEVFSLHPEDTSAYLHLVSGFERKAAEGSPRSFVIDKTGMIWIGTRAHGLFGYKYEDNQLIKMFHFNTSNGLTDNFVTSLACDSSGNIIAGTQTGLDRITMANDLARIENLTKNSNYFAFIADTWVDSDNLAYALTGSGVLLQVSPVKKTEGDYIPGLLIEEIKVNTRVVSLSRSVFPYKENNISFLVAAPSFIDERQIRFSYLLEGSGNDQWSDTTMANSVINLTNLSAGKYLLKIKAFFPSTSYPPAESSFAFEIRPPWWQTWWFKMGIGLSGIILLGWLVRSYYRRKLRQQKIVLEKRQAVEKERTRIATDMHDDLGAGLSRIKFLSETIGIKKQQQQPIEEDISKIREYSHQMIDKMGEIVWALNEKNDSLSDLLSYTRSYAVEYLSQNGIQCTVNLPEQLPTAFVSGEFRRNIFLSVKEILHNVVKHSQANTVRMDMRFDTALVIVISDDGIGFDPLHIRPFSNGLTNIKKRLTDIGGTMNIQSTNGTTLSLSAPLPL